MEVSVFVPGHITGFFNIKNNANHLKNGSCGVGFLVNKGVLTKISTCDTFEIEVNQGDFTVINEVLDILNIKKPLKITQDIQLPIGAGFGTSASSALGLAIGLNEFLNLGYSLEECGQIAHNVEINLGSGLGDVIAQTGKGIVLRTKEGAPGIGEIKSFPNEKIVVATKTFGEIDTASIIQDEEYKKIISNVGLELKEKFMRDSSIKNFLDFSFEFSKKTNLMSDEVSKLVDYFNSLDDILGSSMAMLGNTVFAFAYNEDVFKNLNIENLNIYELDNIGIKYDKN
ncbi:pantoate kinase [uncultured Methanobrevibacter sp.]|uniref:pantoate kinase n=1 Tax=uncultured Methanobrevibacter sp. TaxID=253161 RepID=UPI002623FCBB|nr:pantoate kinase [uncultured Methanobrevibacter sp.]